MKEGVRFLGIDDLSFDFEDVKTSLIGVLYRGKDFIEHIKVPEVDIDGYNADNTVLKVFNRIDDPEQIKAVLLDEISKKFGKLFEPERIDLKQGSTYIQYRGADTEAAEELVSSSTVKGLTPKQIRVAHLIGEEIGKVKHQ